jgi:acyl-[acyl carrier protein]--UDP-N-acetylglucosamine O-acyltransferase
MSPENHVHPTAFVHPTAVVEEGARLFEGVKVWHFSHVRSTAILRQGVSLARDVYVDADVDIGEFSRIQNGVSVYKGVQIGPWCFIGPHVIFTNDLKPRAGNRSWDITPTILEIGCSLGAGSVVRCGLTVGAFAMVGAGAVVTKSVPPFSLAIGFPARIAGMICACGQTLVDPENLQGLVLDCCLERLNLQLIPLAQEVADRVLADN